MPILWMIKGPAMFPAAQVTPQKMHMGSNACPGVVRDDMSTATPTSKIPKDMQNPNQIPSPEYVHFTGKKLVPNNSTATAQQP
jgi:hypothetical protein